MRGLIDSEEIVGKISSFFHYPAGTLLEDLAESCRNMKLVSDEVLPIVQDLRRKGTKCVIATDNMDTLVRYTVPALKLAEYFDDFLVSYDRGLLKFDVDGNSIPFFDSYLKENNLGCKAVLLLDDCMDKSGIYKKRGFDILQVFNSNDFVCKLRRLAS